MNRGVSKFLVVDRASKPTNLRPGRNRLVRDGWWRKG